MTAETEVEEYLPVSVVAKLLKVSTDYVYDHMHAGEFGPILELGEGRSKKRIPESGYKAFVKARLIGQVAP